MVKRLVWKHCYLNISPPNMSNNWLILLQVTLVTDSFSSPVKSTTPQGPRPKPTQASAQPSRPQASSVHPAPSGITAPQRSQGVSSTTPSTRQQTPPQRPATPPTRTPASVTQPPTRSTPPQSQPPTRPIQPQTQPSSAKHPRPLDPPKRVQTPPLQKRTQPPQPQVVSEYNPFDDSSGLPPPMQPSRGVQQPTPAGRRVQAGGTGGGKGSPSDYNPFTAPAGVVSTPGSKGSPSRSTAQPAAPRGSNAPLNPFDDEAGTNPFEDDMNAEEDKKNPFFNWSNIIM